MMLRKIIFISTFFSLCSFSLIAQAADINIHNNTDSYGTAKFTYSPCSSKLGDKGIVQPHQTNFTVPQAVLDTFCRVTTCDAHIFLTKDCSGTEAVTATVDRNKGVIDIKNHVSDRYIITGSGTDITITQIDKNKSWFKSLFSW